MNKLWPQCQLAMNQCAYILASSMKPSLITLVQSYYLPSSFTSSFSALPPSLLFPLPSWDFSALTAWPQSLPHMQSQVNINTKHIQLTKLHRITRTALIVYTAQKLDKRLIGPLILIKIKQALFSILLLAAYWLS